MSIFYIVGKPRGGKSLQAVIAICQELCNKSSHRSIVTNLPLMFDDYERKFWHFPSLWDKVKWIFRGYWRGEKWPKPEQRTRIAKGLRSFCAEHAPHVKDLDDRIRRLQDDETGEFWLYEPRWTYEKRKLIKINRRGTTIDVPDFSYEDGTVRGDENVGNYGTLYVIDEVHIFFPSRAWQRTGEDATFFLSQHGKFKCDVIMVTQHPDQCDKALRNLAQEFMSVRNLKREPIMGFCIGSWFYVIRMLNSPKSANPNIFDTQFVRQNFELYGDLYDTSAGVGVAGSLVPNQEKRGRSLWWLLVPIVIMLWCIFNADKIAAPLSKIASFVTSRLVHQIPIMNQKPNAPKATNAPNDFFANAAQSAKTAFENVQPNPQPQQIVTQRNNQTEQEKDTNFCTGFFILSGVPYVTMSNGEILSGDEVQAVAKKFVVINGKKIPIKYTNPKYVPQASQQIAEPPAPNIMPTYKTIIVTPNENE